jgi:eukaryotic-like serine/threonine-protein kinase
VTSAERWRRIEELCDSALDREPNQRRAFLLTACGGDDALLQDIEGLLLHTSAADRFLAEPAVDLIADALIRESPSFVGQSIGHYMVGERLGAGGMGVVYRADDTKLHRSVALKFLPPDLTRNADAKRRFVLEAQAASALEHPNICTMHEIGETADGQLFLVMAYYAGDTLKTTIERGPLSPAAALEYATQLAEGLVKAHAAGIIHRDIKPANVLVTGDGLVKIVDFGIAKLLGHTSVAPRETAVGTCAYMSPEQHAGLPADERCDVWSLGVVVYEMLAGRVPFGGDHPQAVALAIADRQQVPLTSLRSDVPIALENVVSRALAKRPDDRYQTMDAVLADLRHLQRELAAPSASTRQGSRRRSVAAAGLTLALVAITVGWVARGISRERWASGTATREIERLVDAEDYSAAAALLRQARAVLPHDPTLEKLWSQATADVTISTVPAGADVSYRPYSDDANTWENLGTTPISGARVPKSQYVWRVNKHEFAPISFIDVPPADWSFTLHPDAAVPPEMVVVPGHRVVLGHPLVDVPSVRLADYLIDRHEVTNAEYQKFVDAGGYQRREFWKEPFVKDGHTIPWDRAITAFRDATGRPGPAAWEAGTFLAVRREHPVSGVSWYEAAAYAEWAGKTLPTVYHWTGASQREFAWLFVPGSNFRGGATQPVGRPGALNGFGTTDMAGNVKEWCLNESWAEKRFILGGGYGDPPYMFSFTDAQSPWERRPNYGFRTVKLAGPPPPEALAKLEPLLRDYASERPASDDQFRAFRGLYTYDKGPLDSRIEETETSDLWIREKVTFNAAYRDERVIVHLFKPAAMSRPLQSVVYHPGGGAYLLKKLKASGSLSDEGLEFLIKSGRAVVYPILQGQFERTDGLGVGGKPRAKWRDRVIMQSKDLGRVLDYLATRPDFDSTRIAFFGFSAGGAMAPIHLAIEPRFKAAILSSGGFWSRDPLPEVDALNFVTRVRTPVLMLNARYDSYFPVESAQRPLFRLLGTPDIDKKYLLFDAGHGDLPHRDEAHETLDWLDKYLGPVVR